ncbi:MAG: hypothetical protein ACKVT0_23080, partial [Planctomycetaceae bacterium]
PPYVKFVFCTTEPNTLPDTILSRCQRFDFGTIETMQIAERLSWIAEQEGVVVSPEAIDLVARRARGSLRDSQSLFDQLLAYGQQQISAIDVHLLLGTAPDERLMELGKYLVDRQPAQALALTNAIFSEGTQIGEFLNQLVDYFRDLMILAAGAIDLQLASVASTHRGQLEEQARHWGLHTVLAGLQVLTETQLKFSKVLSGRSLFDLAIVRLSLLDELDDLGELAQLLLSPGQGSGPSDKPRSTGPTSVSGPKKPIEIKPFASSGARPGSTQPPVGRKQTLSTDDLRVSESGYARSTIPLPGVSVPSPSPTFAKGELDSGQLGNLNPYRIQESEISTQENAPLLADSQKPQVNGPVSVKGETSATPSVELLKVGMEAEIFSEIIRSTGDMIRTHLQRASSSAIIGPNALEIRFPMSYTLSKQYCERQEIVSQVEKILARRIGKPAQVRFVLVESNETAALTSAKGPKSFEKSKKGNDLPLDDFVKNIQTVFGATLIDQKTVARPQLTTTQEQEHEHV